MSDNPTALITRKVGPLPVWAYGAIIAAVVWGWYLIRRKEVDSPESPNAFGDDAGTDAGTWDEYFGNTPDTTVGSGTGGSAVTPGSTKPTDNATWFRVSAEHLVALGYEGLSVSNALSKYLSGETLSLGERALVSIAITRWGVPPEGVQPNNAPPPVDPAKPDPQVPRPPIAIGRLPVGARPLPSISTAIPSRR